MVFIDHPGAASNPLRLGQQLDGVHCRRVVGFVHLHARIAMSRFYDKVAWRKLRKRIVARDNYRCVVCHAYVGGVGAARVDHITTIQAAPSRALDPTNLRTLCAACDNQGHSEKGYSARSTRVERFVQGHDDYGLPLNPKHPWSQGGGSI
jgi:5-methylcytosine-specific restriction endonuclease McrA